MNRHRGQSIDDFMAEQEGRMKPLLKLFAFGAGAATALLIIGELVNVGLAIGAWKLSMDEEDANEAV